VSQRANGASAASETPECAGAAGVLFVPPEVDAVRRGYGRGCCGPPCHWLITSLVF
jgi:hypothetical protein